MTDIDGHIMCLAGVFLCFDRKTAVHDVSLALETGHTLTILGPSGCGKTTLLRIIAGLQQPDAGTIWLDGKKVNGPEILVPPQERSVGMIFQNLALWPHLSVSANIGLGLKSRGVGRNRRKRLVSEILESLQMPGYQARYPHTLSAGEQQRTALARAMVLNPRVLLLDEPFSHLDWSLRQDVIGLMKRFAATIVFVTHDQHDALAMGGTLAVMRAGRILQQGSPDEIISEPASAFVRDFVRGLAASAGRS